MEFVVPLPTEDEPYITQSVSLDGRSYVMTFNWNSRSDRWSLSLETEDGDKILDGAVLVMGVDLLRTIPSTLDYVPPGQLWVGGDGDPELTTINGVTLFYVEADA